MERTRDDITIGHLRQLSPLRNTTEETSAEALAAEQARHFGIDPKSEFGQALVRLAQDLYGANLDLHALWRTTLEGLEGLDRSDRIAWFNAKRFLSFQIAKLLDSLQNPSRAVYQSLVTHKGGFASKGPYPIFDNVTALFSATPVITRTATYFFACSEWVEDAFTGREPLHEIYSRLLNPTSISLANHIVDLECGKEAADYMAWNYNSGMAAIDGVISHLVGYEDIILSSRNIYGGTYQLFHDWYGKRSNLKVALEWADAFDGPGFAKIMDAVAARHRRRIDAGRKIYVYLESPCNPHGHVLDVPGIARAAHEQGYRVIADSTVGTPFLHPLLKREDPMERPDFVIHSYTKDLTGTGNTTAGVVIGRNADMFLPKGSSVETRNPDGSSRRVTWDETMFWNVYYIKGGFLDSDKAFEVLSGIRTYELRMLQKAINTTALARILDLHPDINVSSPVLPGNPNHELLKKHMHLGLPAPLFTIDLEGKQGRPAIPREVYKRFLDMLESLGQTNTLALCPALTSHSELSEEALAEAGIAPTTTRLSVGLEDPRIFIAHLQRAAELAIDPTHGGFSDAFPTAEKIDQIYRETYLDVHSRFLAAGAGYEELVSE
jgi:O-acetylhomoserine/O-acetylserine sulfhydrylase-like pyridoxal-dependent enzyme